MLGNGIYEWTLVMAEVANSVWPWLTRLLNDISVNLDNVLRESAEIGLRRALCNHCMFHAA